MKEIKAIVRPTMVGAILEMLSDVADLPGVTVSEVAGWGRTRARGSTDVVSSWGHRLARKSKLELVVSDEAVPAIVAIIEQAARTGAVGDGKIFVYDVEEVVRIRTGERGPGAI